jgi:hypothetical protein
MKKITLLLLGFSALLMAAHTDFDPTGEMPETPGRGTGAVSPKRPEKAGTGILLAKEPKKEGVIPLSNPCLPIKVVYSSSFTAKDLLGWGPTKAKKLTAALNARLFEKENLRLSPSDHEGFVVFAKEPFFGIHSTFLERVRTSNIDAKKEVREAAQKEGRPLGAWASADLVREAPDDPMLIARGSALYYLRVVCGYGKPIGEVGSGKVTKDNILFEQPLLTNSDFEKAIKALKKEHLLD